MTHHVPVPDRRGQRVGVEQVGGPNRQPRRNPHSLPMHQSDHIMTMGPQQLGSSAADISVRPCHQYPHPSIVGHRQMPGGGGQLSLANAPAPSKGLGSGLR
ncbi:hypothetical protein GCM10023319_71790 [Nocardia iowensis]